MDYLEDSERAKPDLSFLNLKSSSSALANAPPLSHTYRRGTRSRSQYSEYEEEEEEDLNPPSHDLGGLIGPPPARLSRFQGAFTHSPTPTHGL